MSSFDSQPENGGIPDRARPPMMKQANVNGIARRKPPIRSNDWAPAIAPMIDPAAMNKSALKNEWVMRWNRPAEYAPTETIFTKPSDARTEGYITGRFG